jgi:hypothetical protein
MEASKRLIRRLVDRGYSLLGSGCYSAVFEGKNKKQAIKIGSTLADPWLIYAEQIQKLDNPLFPRIYSLHCFEYEDYYVAITERLQVLGEDYGPDSSWMNLAREIRDCTSTEPLVRQAGQLLNSLLHTIDYARLDLHHGNIMLRGDQLVLNDPLAEEEIESSFEAWFEENITESCY